jgi:hypothetical protein
MMDEHSEGFSVQALVITQPVPLHVTRLEGDRIPDDFPEGLICLGLFSSAKLVTRFATSPEGAEMLDQMALFTEPRRLVMYGMAYPPGIQARLMALIPEELLTDSTKPWESDSQSYERSTGGSDEGTPPALAEALKGTKQLPVGELVRYEAMRKYPKDLAAELADMLGNALERGARDIVDHALAAMERQFGDKDTPGEST